jgi:hypothetical protein
MFDLATAKTRLGITGTGPDALLQVAIDTSMALAERYCDRKFTYAAETVKFMHFAGRTMFLPRYPIEQVLSSTGLPSETKVHHRLGTVEFHGEQFIEDASISYAGGYKVLPDDLELGIWMILDQVWPSVNQTGGGSTSAGGGAITSISVPDVGTLRFDSGASGSSGGGLSAVGLIPAISINLLDPYRRRTC